MKWRRIQSRRVRRALIYCTGWSKTFISSHRQNTGGFGLKEEDLSSSTLLHERTTLWRMEIGQVAILDVRCQPSAGGPQQVVYIVPGIGVYFAATIDALEQQSSIPSSWRVM